MHGTYEYQAVLFESPVKPVSHFWYLTTSGVEYKSGQSKNVDRRMKRDGQYKGHILIRAVPCSCRLIKDRSGHLKCQREIAFERAHAADRLHESEKFGPTDDVVASAWYFASGDQRAMAVMTWAEDRRCHYGYGRDYVA